MIAFLLKKILSIILLCGLLFLQSCHTSMVSVPIISTQSNVQSESLRLSRIYFEAEQLARKGEWEKSLELVYPLAQKGHRKAQAVVGSIYDQVYDDPNEAFKWYERAADQGFVSAWTNLGVMYLMGRGVDKDERKALELFRMAAEQDNRIAQYNLGHMLYNNGQTRDGVDWMNKAAEQGLPEANEFLRSIR